MSKNNLSEETEKKLMDFFNNTIDPENFSKAIRQLNYIIALSKVNENRNSQKENLERGFNWLNELAEIVNPYFEYKKS